MSNANELVFTNIKKFAKKFGKIAFLEGDTSYDIDDMRDLSDWLKEENLPIIEVFDLYKYPERLKDVIAFNADTLIMGTAGLRTNTKILVKSGLEIAKKSGYRPKNIVDIPLNDYFKFVSHIFECNYYSNMTVFVDEINIDNVIER